MPTVTFVLSLHGGLVWGGLESQAMHTKRALEARGWKVNVHGPTDRDLGDLVHFFGTFEGYWDLARQVQDRGVPYLCSPVFSPPCTGLALRTRALRKSLTDRTLYRGQRRLYEHAKTLIVLTQAELRNLKDFCGSGLPPAVSIPNGLSRALPASPAQRKGVLCAARVDDGKNQLSLIQAMREVPEELTLLGSLSDTEYVDCCKEASESRVHFLGAVPADDPQLGQALVSSKVFALVSRMEVLSLAAIEAACAGARLVLSNTWGAEEYFGVETLFVNPTDPSAIRAAIVQQLAAEESREAIEERRQRYTERFDWARVAEQIEAQYREVLSSP